MNSRFIEQTFHRWGGRLLVAVIVLLTSPLNAQTTHITHFVAPKYPPLARRMTISGQVELKAKVRNTQVFEVEVVSTVHPMLTQSATEAAKEWEFELGGGEATPRTVNIQVIYGFTGKIKSSDPATTVRADFGHLSVRVFITTDAYPTGHYDSIDPPVQPAQSRQR